jgi:GTP cyclohydrolase I
MEFNQIILETLDKKPGNGKHNGNHNENVLTGHKHESIGDDHVGTSTETPMKKGAFDISDAEKKAVIEKHFEKIMDTLGLDLSDDSLSGTPRRVAKMFVDEIFHGLKPENKPRISVFDNKFKYGEMLVEKNIQVTSTCEHHFLPIIGKAHVAYISSGKVIGLSKLNRIVDYFARRPQVQERMTVQIARMLQEVLNTEDVAVLIDAKHYCVACRGIQDESSTTITSEYGGKFKDAKYKDEFLRYVSMELKI